MHRELQIEEPLRQRIWEIARQQRAPFYLYETAGIAKKCRQFASIPYAPKAIHFALMANSSPRFIGIVKAAGLNVFVNSLLHLELVQQLGFRGEEIIYAASAMDGNTMLKVQESGALAVMDSLSQLERWRALFSGAEAGIRCNVGDRVEPRSTLAGYFIGKESRLGLSTDEICSLQGDPGISGLHTYVGTNILDVGYFLECYQRIAELALLFPQLRFVDFGGGFGLAEEDPGQLDMQAYGKEVAALMRGISHKLGREIRLILEPGRIIGGEAGYFVCEVVDIKTRPEQVFIGVNASVAQFPRPLFYPDSAFHPVAVIRATGQAAEGMRRRSSVYGCSTYSRDYLARDLLLPECSSGDLIVLGNAGSYCSGAHTSFLGFPEAEEFYI